MALEALLGVSRRSRHTEDAPLFGDKAEKFEEDDEFVTAFPNATEPMNLIMPPFVSILLK